MNKKMKLAIIAVGGIVILTMIIGVLSALSRSGEAAQKDLTTSIRNWEPMAVADAPWQKHITGFEKNTVVVHIETDLYNKPENKPLAQTICSAYAPFASEPDSGVDVFMVMSAQDTILAKC